MAMPMGPLPHFAGFLIRWRARTVAAHLALTLCAPALAADVPAGVHALAQARRPVSQAVLEHPLVTAVVLRGDWRDVEPEEGRYDWRYFDDEMARVAAAGKPVSLVITSGGRSTPGWLMNRLGQTFRFTDSVRFHQDFGAEVRIPLFWDPLLLAHKKRLIAAMGERYGGRAELRSVSAHCANATTDDWNIPGTPADVETWRAAGFSESRLIDACRDIIDATAAAFPAQAVRMAFGRVPPGLASEGDAVARALIRHGQSRYPGRFYAQRHNLSARTPEPGNSRAAGWKVIGDACPLCAAQFLWPASDTRTCRASGGNTPCDAVDQFRDAARVALDYRLRYVEVYGADLQNPALRDEVVRLAAGLTGSTPAPGVATPLRADPSAQAGPAGWPGARAGESDGGRRSAGPAGRPDGGRRAASMREGGAGGGQIPAGVQNLSFPSAAYGESRRFSIWLPDGYEASQKRYPVLYWLHGKGGDPARSAHLAKYLRQAIADGRMPETIMVFPDGDTDRFYTDGPGGRSPVETMIVGELIPYIDGHFRTIAQRSGRMIEGFSMGGFGALKFAAKYPEKFASVVAFGAPRLDAELGMGGQDARVFDEVFAGDREGFRRNTPAWIFRTNTERVLASGLRIRLVAGSADGTRHSVDKLHRVLDELGIAHEYVMLEGVRHAPAQYYDEDRGAGFALHARALGQK